MLFQNPIRLLGMLAVLWSMALPGAFGAESKSEGRPYGLAERVPWTTSTISGSPEPPSPYTLAPAFPKLKFSEPVDMANASGTDRLFLMELGGKIYSFKNDQSASQPDLLIDLKKSIGGFKEQYGMTFDPGFATNHYLYVCYVQKEGIPDGSRVSRFEVSQTDPPTVDPASERIVITWLSGGHNGGCLKFGPDGCLYISTGDGSGPSPPDSLNTGQDVSDLLSSILRIDVKNPEPGKMYRVPADNPFVNMAGARPEIWAFGLRNPWKMCFDPKTGDLWAADVGWELWELVYRVKKGGNYGWSVVEGRQPVKLGGKVGPTPILPPTVDHPHSEAASITGGYVYRGSRLKDLVGRYLYGDWATGKIWELGYDATHVTSHRELLSSTVQIITFGEDNAGELYVVGYNGLLYQLEPNSQSHAESHFPRRLSQTGLFASTKDQVPAPGVIPYSINAEPWADNATSARFVALPERSTIKTGNGNWIFPSNAVLAKTISIEMNAAKPESRRHLETQVLHYNGSAWNAYTYRWNDEQTDATLIDAAGTNGTFQVTDASAPGGYRTQAWRFHSRAECLRCHNSWCNFALGFNAIEINKEHLYPQPGGSSLNDNEIRALAHIGVLSHDVRDGAPEKLVNPHGSEGDLARRARSYLQVNCSHCHRDGAGGSVVALMNYDADLEKAKMIDAPTLQGSLGLPDAHVVSAGDPSRSVLYYRISTTGQGHMPRIGTTMVDDIGTKLIHDWISQMPISSAVPSSVADLRRQETGWVRQLSSASDLSESQRAELIGKLLASPSGALALLYEFVNGHFAPALHDQIVALAAAHPSFQARDLFERFLPEEQRVKKLGSNINPDEVLALKGDAGRGQTLVHKNPAMQCLQCHIIHGEGRDFGPDLSHIGQKYDRAQLLDQILNPSKVIDQAYVSYQVETADETSYTGFLLKRTDQEITLKDATAQVVHLAADKIKTLQRQSLSAMPEQLLQALTAQEAADLIQYLQSLR